MDAPDGALSEGSLHTHGDSDGPKKSRCVLERDRDIYLTFWKIRGKKRFRNLWICGEHQAKVRSEISRIFVGINSLHFLILRNGVCYNYATPMH